MNQLQEENYSSKLDMGLWLNLFKYMGRIKKEVILSVVFNMLYSLIMAVRPLMNKYAIDTFAIGKDWSTFWPFTIIVIFTFILAGYLTYKTIQYSAVVEVTMVHDIREDGFKNLQNLSFSYYDTTPVGWILARMSSDAQRIGDVVGWSVLDIVYAFFMVLFIIINMFILDSSMAIIGLCMVPIVAAVSVYFQKRLLVSQRDIRKANSKITGAFNEGVMGARTTKTLVRERKNFEEFENLSDDMKKASIFSATLSAVYMPLVMMLGSITVALVIYVGSGKAVTQIITFGTLAAFINYVMQMFEPIQQIARIFAEMQSAQAAGERVVSLINTKPEIAESEAVLAKYGSSLDQKIENWEEIQGEIEFKNVSFSYKTGEAVLENFNLKIEKGQNIALVGATGAGKSTIVNLICRFYEPTDGEILIDGEDYRNRSQSWLHSNLGYVLQTPHLFSGTIMENIRYGRLEASDDEVIEAAKTVNAYEFIMNMDKGFDTDVGEGGNRLSSGEKQLISFARAILRKPAVFVLDEATSSIDTETEQLIQRAIENVLKGRTSFLIAHRLSTIKRCDKILVIEDGKIVENGTHKELIRLKGRYFNLYTNQFIEENEKKLLTS